jgi:hypothetical protein
MDPPVRIDSQTSTSTKTAKCILRLEQLSAEQYLHIEQRCRDLHFSQFGFLKEEQTLHETITTDLAYLQSVGITCRQISDRLKYLIRAADTVPSAGYLTIKPKFPRPQGWILHSVNSSVIADEHGKYEIHIATFNSAQECPFQKESSARREHFGYQYGAQEVILVNCQTKAQLRFSTLLPHLIKRHAFFEGPGLTYRLEPAALIEFLQLKIGINYKPQKILVQSWEFSTTLSMSSPLLRNWIFNQKPLRVYQEVGFYFINSSELDSLAEELEDSGTDKRYLLTAFGTDNPKPAAATDLDSDEDNEESARPELDGIILVDQALIELEEVQYGAFTLFELKVNRELPNSHLAREYRKFSASNS